MATKTNRKRRGPPPAKQLLQPDFPYTVKLPDGRTIYMEVPGRWVTADRDGTPAFLPEGVAFIDRICAVAMPLDSFKAGPSPGYITTFREALGMTQKELGEALGVDGMTVSRWERGTLRPSAASLRAMEKLRKQSVRRGIAIES